MNRGYSTLLVMLVGFLAISLVLGIVVWRFWPKPSSSITPSPTPSPTISPTPTPFENIEWKIYTNEKLGLAFRYPEKWGDLSPEPFPHIKQEKELFQIQTNAKAYTFLATTGNIKKIWYHQPSGMIGFTEKGQKYETIDGQTNFQETLRTIDPNGKITSIFSVKADMAQMKVGIVAVNFSLNGKFVYFTESGLNHEQSYIFNIENQKNILENYQNDIWLDGAAVYQKIFWSPNNKSVAIISAISQFAGQGASGLFVSDYDAPDKLNEVLVFTQEERLGNSYVYNLHFTDDNKLIFSIFSQKCIFSDATFQLTCYEKSSKNYEYNIQERKLTENRSPGK